LGTPRDGSILVQREASAPLVIIGEGALQVAVHGVFSRDRFYKKPGDGADVKK
jgi:hypothetical protein